MTTCAKTLYDRGALEQRALRARKLLSHCTLCPKKCKVNRLKGEKGFCDTGEYAGVASYGPHFGEEQPLVGSHGSGTIFFTGCNLGCLFCQNFDISHGSGSGTEVSPEQLAAIMLELQEQGCGEVPGKGFLVRIIDPGPPFNPLEKSRPDTTLSIDEREIGGLGILLAKELSSAMVYHRHHNRNILDVYFQTPLSENH